MSKAAHTAQQYWDVRSDLFANYYKKPSVFDKLFRKAVYLRTAVALKTIQEYPGCTVLDIGSGPGVNSVTWLKNSQASHLLGIDFAESMNAYARKNAAAEGVENRSEFVEGDFMKYDFGGKKYDVAVAVGVFDYIEDAAGFIKKMDEVSQKAFVISWPENGLRMMLRRWRYTCPVFHYNENEIRRLHSLCKISDLEIVRSQGGWVSVARK
jgi:ubiquinone/menaquinone biosynthesis C-methylase UbiE